MTHGIKMTIGVDLGDRSSRYCVLSAEGEVLREDSVTTSREAFEREFRELRGRYVMEAGTHSPWASRCLGELGHEVVVADPRKLEAISKNARKNDRNDALTLARLGRDLTLLSPVRHRGEQAQADLACLRARAVLVRARTQQVNCLRGLAKCLGVRLPKCSARSFHRQAREKIPAILEPAATPMLEVLEVLEKQILAYDERIEAVAKERYPETEKLRKVKGVGPLTSTAYVLTLEDPKRFAKSRTVGAYVGLAPAQDQSGGRDPDLGISKAGNTFLRQLLVTSAHYILGPFGEDSSLRRWGLALAERGGKNAKKRAVVAVARKLAVLLHRLWLSEEAYDPNHGTPPRARRAPVLAQVS